MVAMSVEELEKLMHYAKVRAQISVPQIQIDLGWNYAKARAYVEELVKHKRIEYKDGVVYQCKFRSSEQQNVMTNEQDKTVKAFERRGPKMKDEPFDINKESVVINDYVKIMNNLHYSANSAQWVRKTTADAPPVGDKLPVEFTKLPQRAKDLVEVAVKVAIVKKSAKLGLFESSLRWDCNSETGVAYTAAIKYIDEITEKEFKTIKYILSNK